MKTGRRLCFPSCSLTSSPRPLRAQVLSASTTLLSVTGPLGFIAAGLLLDRYRSTTPTFVMIGAIGTVGAAISMIAGKGRRERGSH